MARVRLSLMLILLLASCLLFLSSCGDSDESQTDGDNESAGDGDESENVDGDENDAIDGDAEQEDVAEAVTREAVDGVPGWCKTSGTLTRNCESVGDCRAYRQPISTDCTEANIEPVFDCAIANSNDFPAEFDAECHADSKCDHAPVDCVDGLCEFNLPNDNCESDSDCTVFDAGCFCFAMNKDSGTYDPAYGSECESLTACPENSHARCVRGSCRVVGAHLDADIAAFCARFAEWGVDLFGNEAACIEALSRDDYLAAASMLSTIAASAEATSFSGFISGPWSNYYMCIISEQ